MSEELAHHTDDQSHYEVSMTAGQAFVAFVLLLLSLAASFAFGLMIGKGQADERLVVRKEPDIVNEASVLPSAKKKPEGKIVELGVADDEFQATETAPTIIEEGGATGASPVETTTAVIPAAEAAAAPQTPVVETAQATPTVPHYAQLLSSGDQKAAEALAAKVIDRGFSSAYVERGVTDKGPIFRVRVKFPSESEARAAEPKLKEFSKEVWITK